MWWNGCVFWWLNHPWNIGAPITKVTSVTTPPTDSTTDYTFPSFQEGTITYWGPCSSNTTSAISWNNSISLVYLSSGTYSECTITITDTAVNVRGRIKITSFTFETEFSFTVGSSGTVLKSSHGNTWTKFSATNSDNVSVSWWESLTESVLS